MSAQRERSAVEANHRSIHPRIPGVPWWAALLIAVSATAIGYGIDAGMGHKDLTHVFAGFYIAGCVAAVLAVRQEGVFTAIIQPPLILFCAVPGAYWMFHGRKLGNLKDLLINCGYPLIERFPLMLGTAGGVLLIGLVRWYFGKPRAATHSTEETSEEPRSAGNGIGAKLNSLLGLGPREDDAEQAPAARSKRTRTASRSSRDGRTARGERSAARSSRSHSRRARPPLHDEGEPATERPRRRRPAPPRDFDPAEPPPRPRRRQRPPGDPDPRETRREPRAHRDPYDRPAPRSSRFDGYEPYEPPSAPERYERYESYEPRRRRPAPSGNGSSTHHPISRVRYRGEAPLSEPRDPRAERRGGSRAPRGFPAESWEYEG
ncbi:DUF6542 domain-containing protein [Mycobacterium sp. UM_CSW]|uniref:DUF6542 domain-containing protein n=1 Tax=Mycobacterium sp. UM_CSW TaxID=1370119 RepID=UPI000835B332|nr:DUF6542 domain-containing protein [Mycobacterium sp. UM_CSW]